jgi:uracil-DNA glycosylase family 4
LLSKPETCVGCPLYEPPYGKHTGFSYPCGTGANGVLIIAEALGADEEREGMALVGRAGYYTFQNLARVGIIRDDFKIFNTIACRPPENHLSKMPYENEAINHCSPNLDKAITEMQQTCKESGKHFTIITLGRTAFKRVMGLDDKSPIMRNDYLCYPFWSDKYQAFVVAVDHPSYLMRGNSHLLPIFQFGFKRALEIAENGLKFHQPTYLRDPDPATFAQWVTDYKRYALEHPEENHLSFDIETPYKQGKDESEVADDDDESWTILRCSFSYLPGIAISVPWRSDYLASLEDLFGTSFPKVGFNSDQYDLPRILAKVPVNGDRLDVMLMWHVLNSALPKGLGFVAPFYCHDVPAWKYTSDNDPAGYNAMDADITLRCFQGIKADLIKNNQWHVFERHVVQLNTVLGYMSGKGVLRDEVMRAEAETKLSTLLDEVEISMEASVPQEARRFKIFKKTPKDTAGMVQVEKVLPVKHCSICGMVKPSKGHFKEVSAKKKKLGLDNVCEGAEVVVKDELVKLWAKPLEFKVSKVSLSNYQKALKQQAILNHKEKKVTFDEDALKKLIKKYPNDKLYPKILAYREYSKLLGTYIGVTQKAGRIRGGMPVGKDGRIHCVYSHNPSTLRLASMQPNMQNLPRAKKQEDLQTIIRNLIVASPGNLLLELDFSAIEAVLVGWFAGSADYIRLAKLGIHSFLASHVLGRPADLKWSDADLKAYFSEIKKSKDQHVQDVYNSSKRTTHLSGYGGSPKKMHLAEPDAFPTIKDAERLQGIYFEVCPYIKKWQLSTQLQADKDGYLKNPFNYIHRFSQVFTFTKENGKWKRKPGNDSNKVLAFLPQSTAAAVIKEAMLRLYFKRFEEAGQWLRLQVHDSLVSDVPKGLLDIVKSIMKEEMTRPVPELMLPKSYNLGEHLVIDVDSKIGPRWGEMS